jgi:hypothetical protein
MRQIKQRCYFLWRCLHIIETTAISEYRTNLKTQQRIRNADTQRKKFARFNVF